jgi:HSP20 family protein
MALIRWEPAREISSLQQEMNRLFGTFFDSPGGEAAPGRRWIPAMDLVEEGGQYVLRADLPGLSDSDVKIEFDDRVLTISGERRSENEERREGYYRLERASGSFSRSLTLPEGVDSEKIEAHFENGVLEVRIPKPEERKPRRVEVKTGRRDVIEGEASAGGTQAADSEHVADGAAAPQPATA